MFVSSTRSSIKDKLVKNQDRQNRVESPYRLSISKEQGVAHITSECSILSQKEYKKIHDSLGRVTYWQLCRKLGFDHVDNDMNMNLVKYLKLRNMKSCVTLTFKVTDNRRLELVVEDKENRKCQIYFTVTNVEKSRWEV